MERPMLSVHLDMENPTNETQSVFLEKGRCFEVVDPSSGLQNAVLAENVQVSIPPHSQIEVDIPAFCLNRYRRMSGRRDANVTPFLLADPCMSQKEIWEKMALPKAA